MRATELMQPADLEALDALRRYGTHPSAFLAFNGETVHFRPEHRDGLIAYRPAGGRHVVQLFGPLAEPEERRGVLERGVLRPSRRSNMP